MAGVKANSSGWRLRSTSPRNLYENASFNKPAELYYFEFAD
jgi:hypothetical protein